MEYEDCYLQAQRPKYDCLLFDLDDTLYPLSSGLAAACGQNIKDYMVEQLGIEKSKITELGNLLYKNYGTTMAGLRAIGYDFDYDEYHSYVHGRLPYGNLKPDPVLRSLLLSLPIRKVTPIVCKPSEIAIERALEIANLNPQRTLFFEDSVRNIQAGKRVGLDTVLVGTSQRVKGADYALESIHNLREAAPELWESEIKTEVGYPGKVPRETPVTA
ncbi:hypothetical protein GH714_010078 [Hevea brasiliensis]|uniref:Uncharacterized protein n=1 Tax=Hevea brasiliensis TaxID=3981 RepID=A0A6A6KID5_HEVBR|nr:hypothetical protein GH714_010078 [Hevea brasiliensis]